MWGNRTRAIAPNEEWVASGTKLPCQIDRGAAGRSGTVRDEKGVIRWRYAFRKNASGRGSLTVKITQALCHLADFTVANDFVVDFGNVTR